jgi:acyl-CoA thioester hydrolase
MRFTTPGKWAKWSGRANCAQRGLGVGALSQVRLAAGVPTCYNQRMKDYIWVASIPVRFRDIDGMGHVNNAVYLTYFEAARIPYCLQLAGASGARQADMIVAEITCTYHSPAVYGETMQAGVRVEEIREHSFTLSYRIEDEATGRLVATGSSVQVGYDYQAKSVRPVSEMFTTAAEAYEGRPLRVSKP